MGAGAPALPAIAPLLNLAAEPVGADRPIWRGDRRAELRIWLNQYFNRTSPNYLGVLCPKSNSDRRLAEIIADIASMSSW